MENLTQLVARSMQTDVQGVARKTQAGSHLGPGKFEQVPHLYDLARLRRQRAERPVQKEDEVLAAERFQGVRRLGREKISLIGVGARFPGRSGLSQGDMPPKIHLAPVCGPAANIAANLVDPQMESS